ncbi:MAG: ABC transporter substrate-binding protein [Acetatifactor sp.]|nr:ABC transporter substrate-binding protein [Acetatifactor sp.]
MKKKVLSVLLAASMVASLTACGNGAAESSATIDIVESSSAVASSDSTGSDVVEVEYVRADDEEVYDAILGDFTAMTDAAKAAATNDERFMLFAQAEAYLLDSACMIPNTTQNGAYTISRIAPRTVPYVQWGNDDDRLKSMVISDEFCTPEERADMLAEWAKAVAGEATYDPAAYLKSKGHTIQTDYTTTFSTAPVTLDWLNTSSQADTEITVNCVEGLVEYNNLGQMKAALATDWSVSDDGMTYTFNIRKGVKWYTSEGTAYADVTAKDFVAGFHHMLDTQAGLEWLVDGVVKGAGDYLAGGSFDEVGYKAVDDYTLEVTLEQPTSYFLTMLTYSCFLPICESFYASHGGVYGIDEYAAASADTNTYNFGSSEDVASQVYCGPFLIQKLQKDSEIYIVKNKNYWNASAVTLNSIKWVYDAGENPEALYDDVINGVYAGTGLTKASGLLDKAIADGNFDKYHYISDTTSTTYFGGLNLNRGTFALEGGACASPKNEQQKIDTNTALQNKNFRKAMMYAFDKATVNAVSRGEELKCTNLRNMYTHPQFVQLEGAVTDADGHTFAAGTFYGDMVQYYCDKLGLGINVADGVDGWYNADSAKKALEAAKSELGSSVSYPIQIDVVYYSASDANTAQAAAYKSVIEGTLGAENVQVNLVEATTSDDYYASGYRASNGEAGNYDMFYGSGWGPDYGDPSTYLDTFLGEGAGYMTKVIGLF